MAVLAGAPRVYNTSSRLPAVSLPSAYVPQMVSGLSGLSGPMFSPSGGGRFSPIPRGGPTGPSLSPAGGGGSGSVISPFGPARIGPSAPTSGGGGGIGAPQTQRGGSVGGGSGGVGIGAPRSDPTNPGILPNFIGSMVPGVVTSAQAAGGGDSGIIGNFINNITAGLSRNAQNVGAGGSGTVGSWISGMSNSLANNMNAGANFSPNIAPPKMGFGTPGQIAPPQGYIVPGTGVSIPDIRPNYPFGAGSGSGNPFQPISSRFPPSAPPLAQPTDIDKLALWPPQPLVQPGGPGDGEKKSAVIDAGGGGDISRGDTAVMDQDKQQQQQQGPKDNTMTYVLLGGAALLAILLLK